MRFFNNAIPVKILLQTARRYASSLTPAVVDAAVSAELLPMIKTLKQQAAQAHKPALILQGEDHFCLRSRAVGVALLSLSKTYLQVNRFAAELDEETYDMLTLQAELHADHEKFKLNFFHYLQAAEKLKLKILPMDTYSFLSNSTKPEAEVDEIREQAMAKNLMHEVEPTIAIVGAAHLKGLLVSKQLQQVYQVAAITTVQNLHDSVPGLIVIPNAKIPYLK